MSIKPDPAEDAVNLASEVLKEVATKDKAVVRRDPIQAARRRVMILAAIVCVLAALLVLRVVSTEDYGPSAAQTRQYLREDMSLLAYELDAYLAAYGRYPGELTELGFEAGTASIWRYERPAPTHYRLQVSEAGESVDYDSRVPAEVFFADVREN